MKNKDILLIVVPSFLLIIAWVAFNIYHNTVSSTIPETLNVQIVPINPSFDSKTIQSLKNRARIEPMYQSSASNIEESSPSGRVVNPVFPIQVVGSEEGELE